MWQTSNSPLASRYRLSPEAQLLVFCLRQTLHQNNLPEDRTPPITNINYENFLQLVDLHRVAPIISQNLDALDGYGIPPAIREAIRQRATHNRMKCLTLTAELLRVCKALDQQGITAYPLKGPALAMQLYGNISRRHAGDLDLLVSPSQVEPAKSILQELGYQCTEPDFTLPAHRQDLYKIMVHHYAFWHPEQHISIELHWRLLWDRHVIAKNDSRWFSDTATELIIGGYSIPCMPTSRLLFYLCLHGSTHAWVRLSWLYDIAQLIQHNQALNWSAMIQEARKLGCLRSLLLGTALAHLLFDCPMPATISDQWQADAALPYLISTTYCFINDPFTKILSGKQSIQLFLYLLRQGYSLPQALHLLSYKIILLGWEILQIHNILLPLYVFLKPFLAMERRRRLTCQH